MTSTRPFSGRATAAPGQSKPVSRLWTALATSVVLGVGLAGCGSSSVTSTHTAKAEIDPRLGVAPSPRVVAMGKPVPKGGGRSMVGKPYTVAGKRYVPRLDPDYEAVGMASWYGDAFHGRRTANGEVFDANSLTAAHPTMPLPSYARVTSLTTGRSVMVRVNDRGPFHSNRVLDMSRRTAEMLGVRSAGIAKIQVEYVGPAPTEGDDSRYLMASYRGPADVAPSMPETLVASATALPGVALRGVADTVSSTVGSFLPASGEPEAPAAVAAPAAAPAESAAPVMVASVLPQPRPVVIETFAVVASADPAAVLVAEEPVQLASLAPGGASPLPPVVPAAYQVDVPPAAQPAMTFQVGPQPVARPIATARASYAEDRVAQAYAAVDGIGGGVGLGDLTRSLEALAAPRADSAAVTVQVGLFGDPANAARVIAAFETLATATVDEVTVDGRVLKRVRVSAVDPSVTVDALIAAAERAGARGARVVR
jgi:rare lipoprotein A